MNPVSLKGVKYRHVNNYDTWQSRNVTPSAQKEEEERSEAVGIALGSAAQEKGGRAEDEVQIPAGNHVKR